MPRTPESEFLSQIEREDFEIDGEKVAADKEGSSLIELYRNAETDEERTALLDSLRKISLLPGLSAKTRFEIIDLISEDDFNSNKERSLQ